MTGTDTTNTPSSVTPTKMDGAHKAKLKKAAKQFESLFTSYMLKSMRKSVPESGMFGDDFGGDMLEDMFDMEFANQMSKGNSFGVAEMLYRKLTGESLEQNPEMLQMLEENGTLKKTLQPTSKGKNKIPFMKPSRSMEARIGQYQSIIDTAAETHGVDSTLVKAVIASESAGRADARSPKHAKGLMQLIDSTAQEMGVQNVWNPEENIQGGVKYLKQMLLKFHGDVKLALASYNAGPAAVERHNGIPPYKETQEYITRVMNYWQHFQEQETDDHE
ncbi:MAG TPA: transglycosylase SLT domain-containing protein [Bacteroidota bacterium]|nr:transglycosylase SLT domain-containing protein [Bacteroidota bacterium]